MFSISPTLMSTRSVSFKSSPVFRSNVHPKYLHPPRSVRVSSTCNILRIFSSIYIILASTLYKHSHSATSSSPYRSLIFSMSSQIISRTFISGHSSRSFPGMCNNLPLPANQSCSSSSKNCMIFSAATVSPETTGLS